MANHRNFTVEVPIEKARKDQRFNLLMKPVYRERLDRLAEGRGSRATVIRRLVIAAYQDRDLLVISDEALDGSEGDNFQVIVQAAVRKMLDELAISLAPQIGEVNRSLVVRALIDAAEANPDAFGLSEDEEPAPKGNAHLEPVLA